MEVGRVGMVGALLGDRPRGGVIVVAPPPPPVVESINLEDGTAILLEDGTELLLE